MTEQVSNVDGLIESNCNEVHESFDDMNLRDELLRGIYGYGFEVPSAIQQRAIVPSLQGRDLIAQAQSGTGKTATFSISILQRIDFTLPEVQALVLVPNRELAQQIRKIIMALGDYMGVVCHACIGGKIVTEEARTIKDSGTHVIIGTPGGVFDLMTKRKLTIKYIKMLVLDEADEMFSKGFRDQVYNILQQIRSKYHVFLLSTTMPKEVLQLSKKLKNDPIIIIVKKKELPLENIRHFYIDVNDNRSKFPILIKLFQKRKIDQAVVYTNTCNKILELKKSLIKKDIKASHIYYKIESERIQAISEFKAGSTAALILTDQLARGIDVPKVSFVINLDFPLNKEDYIHRIAPNYRFGMKIVCVSFVRTKDKILMKSFANANSSAIEKFPDDIESIKKLIC